METYLNNVGFLVAVLYGIIGVALGLPLALRKIPRNRLYGFRLGATLTDDEIWYRVNGNFGKEFTALGIVTLLMGSTSFFLFRDKAGQLVLLVIVCVVFMGGVVLSLVRGIHLMNRMAREKGLQK
jgi:hypothetical protein